MHRARAFYALFLLLPLMLAARNAGAANGTDWAWIDNSGNLVAVAPDNSSIALKGQCDLQTLSDHAQNNSFNLVIVGNEQTSRHAVCNIEAPLSFGPLQGANWEFGNLVYMPSSDFGPSATMTFDSMMQVHLDIKGQIGATGFGGNVVFKPRTQVPIDHAVGLTASVITISGTAFNQPACNIDREGIVFDATGGSISSIDFTVIEANGAGPPGSTACGSYGIHIKTANGNGFVLNHVKFIQLHLYKTAGLKIDIDGARNPHAVSQNIFDGFALPPSPSAPPAQLYGFWVYGTLNLFIGGISNNEGTATCGVYLEGGTTANKFVLAANLATKPTCGPGNPSQNVFF